MVEALSRKTVIVRRFRTAPTIVATASSGEQIERLFWIAASALVGSFEMAVESVLSIGLLARGPHSRL
jgi:hypothetical protein